MSLLWSYLRSPNDKTATPLLGGIEKVCGTDATSERMSSSPSVINGKFTELNQSFENKDRWVNRDIRHFTKLLLYLTETWITADAIAICLLIPRANSPSLMKKTQRYHFQGLLHGLGPCFTTAFVVFLGSAHQVVEIGPLSAPVMKGGRRVVSRSFSLRTCLGSRTTRKPT